MTKQVNRPSKPSLARALTMVQDQVFATKPGAVRKAVQHIYTNPTNGFRVHTFSQPV